MDDGSREFELRHLRETIQFAEQREESAARELQILENKIEQLQPQVSAENPEALARFLVAQDMAEQTADVLRGCGKAKESPYFGRIDFEESGHSKERLYIGRAGLYDEEQRVPVVIDWRTPAAGLYYDAEPGEAAYQTEETTIRGHLYRKRTYNISEGKLCDYYDADLVTSDELLQAYLAKNASSVLKDIVATIQKDQNAIIRISPWKSVIVQGVAGSGKTTVALHRLAYLIFNDSDTHSADAYAVIGGNRMFLGYISGMLPDLGVEGIRQFVMPELFADYLGDNPEWVSLHRESAPFRSSADLFYIIQSKLDSLERELLYHPISLHGRVLINRDELNTVIFGGRKKSLERKAELLHERLAVRVREAVPVLEQRIERYHDDALAAFKAGEKSEYSSAAAIIDAKYAELAELAAETKALKTLYKRQVKALRSKKLYQEILKEQGYKPNRIPDVYDLAALCYIEQRLHTRESKLRHIVVDEAQDFGPLLYLCMTEVFENAGFTILGDLSQNIGDDVGLIRWEDILDSAFSRKEHRFCVLSKSYRNTVEIAETANRVLERLGTSIYPVEPVVRHGDPVQWTLLPDREALFRAAEAEAAEWQSGSLAFVCTDAAEAQALQNRIPGSQLITAGNEADYMGGITVFDAASVKGLEFDRVIVVSAGISAYPDDRKGIHLLYVVLTRALHTLRILLEEREPSLLREIFEESENNY